MALLPLLTNTLWKLSIRGDASDFARSLASVKATQKRLLFGLLQRNRETRFGREHDFAAIRSVSEYQKRVPLSDYTDYSATMEMIARGQPAVLSSDKVELFEPTGGSTAAVKLIPYNRSLKREFQRGIAPWVAQLFRQYPKIAGGTAYWSISPLDQKAEKYGSIPIGFQEDSEYLGAFGRYLSSCVFAVPSRLRQLTDPHEFFLQTAVHLISAHNLTLISVWSPTFLTRLLEFISAHSEEILSSLAGLHTVSSARRRHIEKALCALDPQSLWPKLQLISCWAHGPSEVYAKQLKNSFPDIPVQPKGLLATEAFISLPYTAQHDPVLAVTSHFFEFEEIEGGAVCLADQLQVDREYSVIVTTGGGLYRYRMHDRVRVTSSLGGAPCMVFVGRENVVDLFGEKLHAAFVQKELELLFDSLNLSPKFYLLAPTAEGIDHQVCYSLFLAMDEQTVGSRLVIELEKRLRTGYHYNQCRLLQQLGPARVYLIKETDQSVVEQYHRALRDRSVREGAMKIGVLDHALNWNQRFNCRRIDTSGDSDAD